MNSSDFVAQRRSAPSRSGAWPPPGEKASRIRDTFRILIILLNHIVDVESKYDIRNMNSTLKFKNFDWHFYFSSQTAHISVNTFFDFRTLRLDLK